MAAACAAGALCVYVAAFHVTRVTDADFRIYFASAAVLEPHSKLLNDFVGLLDPARYAILAPVPPVIAFWRRRPRLALAAVALIGGATLTTEALKGLTRAPRFPVTGEIVSWPSGHMTAATALALALILVVPARWRFTAAVAGTLWVVAIAGTILLLGMHLASDVVAGMLVAGAWAGLAIAVLRAWPDSPPRDDAEDPSRLARPLAGAAGLAVTAGAIAAALADDQDQSAVHADPVAIAAGALVVAGIAVVIIGATALGARRIG